MSMFPKTLVLFFSLLSFGSLPLWAWDLEVGLQRTKPQIGYRDQTYQSNSGDWSFKPDGEATIFGQSVVLGVGIDWALIEYEQASFETTIEATDSTGAALMLSPSFTQERLGLMYRAERELAGFFLGGGLERSTESFSYNGAEYSHQAESLYFKGGIQLIFGALRVRAEQIHGQLGEHTLKTNSVGLLFQF